MAEAVAAHNWQGGPVRQISPGKAPFRLFGKGAPAKHRFVSARDSRQSTVSFGQQECPGSVPSSFGRGAWQSAVSFRQGAPVENRLVSARKPRQKTVSFWQESPGKTPSRFGKEASAEYRLVSAREFKQRTIWFWTERMPRQSTFLFQQGSPSRAPYCFGKGVPAEHRLVLYSKSTVSFWQGGLAEYRPVSVRSPSRELSRFGKGSPGREPIRFGKRAPEKHRLASARKIVQSTVSFRQKRPGRAPSCFIQQGFPGRAPSPFGKGAWQSTVLFR